MIYFIAFFSILLALITIVASFLVIVGVPVKFTPKHWSEKAQFTVFLISFLIWVSFIGALIAGSTTST